MKKRERFLKNILKMSKTGCNQRQEKHTKRVVFVRFKSSPPLLTTPRALESRFAFLGLNLRSQVRF
jgi:hypothetical protein